ncbi:glutamate receptor ionotropic, delta-1-like [Homarus americanus]|uniref:glutamate receptor ionotropic, delta-1-like n=1 Tax=Homarus americanus TaxID=6706 RepID=UPI001C48A111|nr:glutamate receptor ionotropic, delta-1-like [Homarus americanus]
MMWMGVYVLVWAARMGVQGVDHKVECYPGLLHFLLDYIDHYTYSEVHLVFQGRDDLELMRAGRQLILRRQAVTINFLDLNTHPEGLQTIAASTRSPPGSRVSYSVPGAYNKPPYFQLYRKPIFITSVLSTRALRRSFNVCGKYAEFMFAFVTHALRKQVSEGPWASLTLWSVGEEARVSPWVIIGISSDLLIREGHYFPLDNMVTLALWDRSWSLRQVALWEVYQAARNLTHRISKVGFWTLPPNLAQDAETCPAAMNVSSGYNESQEKGTRREKEEEKEEEEQETQSFPNANIASRRMDLTGLHIRCLTLSWQPFADNVPDGKGGITIGGFMGESFHLMSTVLNFTYECHNAPDRQFGNYENGSWTGLVGELVADQGDVSITALDYTYQRSSVVDFTFPSGNIEYSLVVKRPEADPWSNFTRQLQANTWLACLAFFLIAPLLYHILASYSRSVPPSSLQDSLFTVHTLMLNQGSLSTENVFSRIFLITVVLTTWLTITFYTSVLISSLTVPLITPPFTDTAGILKAGTHNLGLQRGNSEVERLRTSKDPILHKIWTDIVLRDPKNFVATPEEGLQKALREPYVFMIEENFLMFNYGSNCSLYRLREKVFKFGAGMATQKNSPLQMVLNHQVLIQHVAGILDRSEKKYRLPPPLCESDTVEALGLTPLITPFILLLVSVFLAPLLLLVETLYYKFFRKRTKIGRSSVWKLNKHMGSQPIVVNEPGMNYQQN